MLLAAASEAVVRVSCYPALQVPEKVVWACRVMLSNPLDAPTFVVSPDSRNVVGTEKAKVDHPTNAATAAGGRATGLVARSGRDSIW
ncbi:MAG: hypothetical protein M1815_002927 [Lichina confinis]|nr:MAG: hypothetical protein M1815_002927 [Lichina confinis]